MSERSKHAGIDKFLTVLMEPFVKPKVRIRELEAKVERLSDAIRKHLRMCVQVGQPDDSCGCEAEDVALCRALEEK